MANAKQQAYQRQNQDRNFNKNRRQRLEEEQKAREEELKELEEKDKLAEPKNEDRLDAPTAKDELDPNDPDYLEPALYEIDMSKPVIPDVVVETQQDKIRDIEEMDINRVYHSTYDRLSKDEVFKHVSTTAKMCLEGIIDYVAKMKQYNGHMLTMMRDNNFVVNEGPAMQVKLFLDIMDIITKTDSVSFRYSMDFLLQLMREETEVLGFLNLSRFQENLQLDLVQQACYPNLMNMLTTLKDPATRQSNLRTSIDLNKALEYGFSDGAKTRLLNYFHN